MDNEPPSKPGPVTVCGAREWKIPEVPALRKQIIKVMRGEKKTGPVTLVFQDPQSQRALNLEWRKLDRTTDVLSFPYEEPELFGELYIDPELAMEQAKRLGHTLEVELRRLVTHGTLHLCGYDHMTAPERKAMRALEDHYDPATA
ncbi:MAG: rRNA maturation RNase YbeY [Fibrobacterota bacterium]|jgi:probable rRNA maturation factor